MQLHQLSLLLSICLLGLLASVVQAVPSPTITNRAEVYEYISTPVVPKLVARPSHTCTAYNYSCPKIHNMPAAININRYGKSGRFSCTYVDDLICTYQDAYLKSGPTSICPHFCAQTCTTFSSSKRAAAAVVANGPYAKRQWTKAKEIRGGPSKGRSLEKRRVVFGR